MQRFHPPQWLVIVGFSYKAVLHINEENGQLWRVQSIYQVHDSNSSFLFYVEGGGYCRSTTLPAILLHPCSVAASIFKPRHHLLSNGFIKHIIVFMLLRENLIE